jgi:hypothetical protein
MEEKKKNDVFAWLAAILMWVLIILAATGSGGQVLVYVGLGIALSYLILYRK